MESSVPKSKNNSFIFLVAGIAAFAGLLFGYDTGVISGALLFIKKQFQLSAVLQEMVVSSVLLGAIIGAFLSGFVTDKIGRRKTIIITALIFSIGAVGSAFAPETMFLVVCRFFIGIAIGIASYAAPLYISEVAPPKLRGALVSLNQLLITVGILVSYIVDLAFSNIEGWRWMLGLGVIPAGVLFFGMFFLPRSPRWLASCSKDDEARRVLKKIRGTEDVEEEMQDIQKTISQESGSWKELLEPWVKPALIIGIVFAFFQQCTGINTVIYYAPTIFEMAGFQSAKASIFATTIVGIVNVGMTVVAIWLLDKVGRKPLLFFGLIGMVTGLAALGIVFDMNASAGIVKWITVGSLVLYIASFAVSLGPIFWLIIAEIYPLRVRGRAMSLATVANWVFNLIVASTFLSLIDGLGRGNTFFLFAGISVAGIFFCHFFIPETKGLSLEKIEDHMKSGKSLRTLSEK